MAHTLTNLCQWVGVALGLLGFLLIEKKNRLGWVSWFISSGLLIVYFIANKQGIGIVVLQLVYMVMNIRGWIAWRKIDKKD